MKRLKLLISIWALLLGMLLPLAASAFSLPFSTPPSVPAAASTIGKILDKQIKARYINADFPISALTIICTVPASLTNLNMSSPLARQVAEEMSAFFVNEGYTVSDIRKGDDIVINSQGELLLTRDVKRLAESTATGIAVLVGTYTTTSENVRFNLSLIHIPSNQILAKASATIPLTLELMPLLADSYSIPKLMPSVQTKLP